MKKSRVLALGTVIALSLTSLAACGTDKTNSDDSQSSKKDTKKIGIIQLVEHNALDAAHKGFVDGLAEAGYKDGDKIELLSKNAQGEQANCATIASQLVTANCDLILAIATPAAQAVANETKDIPILVTAVTDPATAKLVKTNDEPGGNVTGTSDMSPIEKQMELLTQLVPNAKKVAMLYCSSEANSTFQVKIAAEAASKLGLESVDATVSESSEIRQVVESLKGKVDAIYAPTDNLISAGMSTVAMVANEIGIPIIAGEEGPCQSGALASYTINYYELGKQTAAQAVQILEGKTTPASMPIEYLKNTDLIINEDAASVLGITIPDSLKTSAKLIKTEAVNE